MMLEYRVSARRIDSHGSEATAKDARIVLDTDMAGRPDAFNPVRDCCWRALRRAS